MRPHWVIVLPPALHEHLRRVQRIKQFPAQQFISQFAIKGLDIAILPRTAGLDKQGTPR